MESEGKIIEELVDENFVYARVLHYFGIHFYDNRKKTIQSVCLENNIDKKKLDTFLSEVKSPTKLSINQLNKYPVRLIVEYLKHSHQIFIKDKLPYILKLINSLDGDSRLINDLKFVLPMFVEDFIKHIYEEEDRLFSYLLKLESFLKNKSQSAVISKRKENFSIQEFALHHESSDQELSGIRGITSNYDTANIEDIHLRVLFNELEQFDKELSKHAMVENKILFPKALALEKLALSKLQQNSTLN